MAFVSSVSLSSSAAASKLVSKTTVAKAAKISMVADNKKVAVPAAAMSSLMIAMPALATEGTGEALGIDSNLLLIPLVLIPIAFFALFIQFASKQDNEDFFGGYDQRRK
mmetsp:Transcript_1758/g.3032  ORF Transcript_1758/g.3032 Transcript_1758/m.3032 type:complete len:109 (+) Transcript_1758:295-621(+)|eukprot:CAMPEP_0184691298 /NCGR_PEP_ID=MMETSP0313-20130426/191_1 /TAXON_ID=2792 /ORGANISM="Porphyridium aerugineum, Strain SAG 1380-2" /LENGTH=108 /DNA_ID=CAMNT_0027148983 /DNA_START=276 /DNA_END=602 /DNA_ORIENTATION=-